MKPAIAYETTKGTLTARFGAVTTQSSAATPDEARDGPVQGIVDFRARRAVVRYVGMPGARSLGAGGEAAPGVPVYAFCEGPATAGGLPGRWGQLFPEWPAELPRKSDELRFLDVFPRASVIEEQADGSEEVGGVATERWRVTVEVDRGQWTPPPRRPGARGRKSLAARLSTLTLPDPRPHGLLRGEAWIDGKCRIRCFGWTEDRRSARWTTTALWDFGVPPPIGDIREQPVIDPVTMEPATIWPPPPLG
jgi:hypothetical protein